MAIRELYEKIGIDKCTLNNIKIYPTMELEKEIYESHVSYEQLMHSKNPYTIFGNGYTLEIYHHGQEERQCIFFNVHLTLWIVSDTGNLNNQTLEDIKQKLTWACKDVREKYGLLLDCENAAFYNLELNATFILPLEYPAYNTAVKIIEKLMDSKRMKALEYASKGKDGEDLNNETAVLFNKSQKFMIYDKSKQMTQKGKPGTQNQITEINKPIMRIEWSLTTPEKVKNVFKTRSLNELSDEDLRNAYLGFFQKNLISKIKKHEEKSMKKCKCYFLQSLSKGKTNQFDAETFAQYFWSDTYKNGIPPFLEIDDMQEVFTAREKEKKRKTGWTVDRIRASFEKGPAKDILHQKKYLQDICDGVMRCAANMEGDKAVMIDVTYSDNS